MSGRDVPFRLGHRLSLKGQTLTVRYHGPVAGKPGQWLGVEWDDTKRGKHDGVHEGHRYFTCASLSPTAASFLRPNQPWDTPQSFLEALAEKYVSHQSTAEDEIVYISGKQAEEVGFDKFARRQAELRGIHVLVLERMRITHERSQSPENSNITAVCAGITDLDLSGNLLESFPDVLDLCIRLPKLRSLTINTNRFQIDPPGDATVQALEGLHDLGLANTLLDWTSLATLTTEYFPNLRTLAVQHNEWNAMTEVLLPRNLRKIDLDENIITSLRDIGCLSHAPLRILSLKSNKIRQVGQIPLNQIEELDLGYNEINDFVFFDHLESSFPSLKHLRVTGNPLYRSLTAADGKPLTAEDGYMLTVARLPRLETLNYSKITEKERLNAEMYYLSQIGEELKRSPPDRRQTVLSRHQRWEALCEEYGEPNLDTSASATDGPPPNSVAARLLSCSFTLSSTFAGADTTEAWMRDRHWVEELPKSWSIYTTLGIVGRRLGIMPLRLRLIWETGERDPVRSNQSQGQPEWWDSDGGEDEDEDENEDVSDGDTAAWMWREVDLVAGTRALGTYIDGQSAKIRVEMIDKSPMVER